MITPLLLFLLGFILLWQGANWTIVGTTHLGRLFKLPDFLLGLTAVAIGTAIPKMMVGSFAALSGHSTVLWGTLLGGSLLNLTLILGAASLIGPLLFSDRILKQVIPFSLGSLILLFFLLSRGTPSSLTLFGAILLLTSYALYLALQLKSNYSVVYIDTKPLLPFWKSLFLFCLGLVALPIGAKLILQETILISTILAIPQEVIALFVVGIGTSLPAGITTLASVLQKKSELAVGTLIGANLINIFVVLGVCGTLKTIPFNPLFYIDIVGLFLVTLLVYLFIQINEKPQLNRYQSGFLIGLYFLYAASLFYRGF